MHLNKNHLILFKKRGYQDTTLHKRRDAIITSAPLPQIKISFIFYSEIEISFIFFFWAKKLIFCPKFSLFAPAGEYFHLNSLIIDQKIYLLIQKQIFRGAQKSQFPPLTINFSPVLRPDPDINVL